MAAHPSQASIAHACEPLQIRIRRFPRGYRRRLRKLVRGSKPLKELLYSFPGAAFMLAARSRSPCAHGQALKVVASGRPLQEVAAALDLPLWLRRLPPEAFATPVRRLSDGPEFARAIVNLIPDDPAATPMWLQWIAFATEACDDAFALWLARQPIFSAQHGYTIPLLPLAAFAWFSGRPNETAYRLIGKAWHSKMRFHIAVHQTRRWFERIVIKHCLGDETHGRSWFETGKSRGYRIVPLCSRDALREEGARMQNCVATYWSRVSVGASLIYSVRCGERRVATMEIIRAVARAAEARIAQLEGPGNTRAHRDVWQAAESWLARQGSFPTNVEAAMARIPPYCSRWQEIWRPYGAAKPEFGAQLLQPRTAALMRFCADLKTLGQRHPA
jgi:hypothetical protein